MKLSSKIISCAVSISWHCAIASLQLSLIPTVAIPQNSHGCFMLDNDGNPMDLGHLCGSDRNNANTSVIRNRSSNISNNSDVFIIPIKRREGGRFGTPVIDVKFNDKYIFEMLFDTGATMTVVTESMAQTMKAQKTGSLPFQTASNNLIFFETARVSSVSTGNAKINNLNVAISPSLKMGLLGQDFYGMYEYTVKENTIEIRKK